MNALAGRQAVLLYIYICEGMEGGLISHLMIILIFALNFSTEITYIGISNILEGTQNEVPLTITMTFLLHHLAGRSQSLSTSCAC